jgi:hypothetical protein
MNDREFGALCLQLLEAATFPGAALAQVIAFRDVAKALAEGQAQIQPAIPITDTAVRT